MANFTNVVIGIQARSTSRRFPRKSFELIDGKPLLKHVIDACEKAAVYINKFKDKTHIMATVAVLTPYDDEIKQGFKGKTLILEGPEQDVLSRYKQAADKLRADYMVRVTGDCPLIPSYLITKHIRTAIMNQFDYVSNVDEETRTAPDGQDCEVFSKKLLDWLDENAKQAPEREHVTLLARHSPPVWAKIGHVIGYLSLGNMKLSVDTPEDLERVKEVYQGIKSKIESAEYRHGKGSVHRF